MTLSNCLQVALRRSLAALLALSALLPAVATAQTSGGPDAVGYTWVQAPFEWDELQSAVRTPVAGATYLPLTDDNNSGAINIGFNFTHYGNPYNQLYIAPNGFVTFTAYAGTSGVTAQLLPNATDPDNLIAGYQADLFPNAVGSQGAVYYSLLGTAPYRRFVVEWKDVPEYGQLANTQSFQVVLFEGTQSFEIRHLLTRAGLVRDFSTGFENADGSRGLSIRNGRYGFVETAWHAGPQRLLVTGLTSPRTGGTPGTIVVEARAANGTRLTGYTGTVSFRSTDAAATLPGNYTFTVADQGIHTFTNGVTLETSGTHTLTVRDTSNPQYVGHHVPVTVNAPPASLVISAITSPRAAGVPTTFNVEAVDRFGARVTNYTGTVTFTSDDPLATIPGNVTFTLANAGVRTVAGLNLRTAGAVTFTARDTASPSLTGAIVIQVDPAAAASFVVTGFPSPIQAGTSAAATFEVRDAFGNRATNYTGTARFSSNDASAVLPSDYVFSAVDAGIATLTFTLVTSGTRSITATDTLDGAVVGTQAAITVQPAATTRLAVTGLVSPRTAGTAGTVTLTAQDAFGNRTPAYTGTVAFTSTDAQAGLPANYTFVAGDAGQRTFTNGVTLRTAATHSVTATDTVTAAINGSQTGVVVNPAAAASFVVTGLVSPVSGGVPGTVVVEALDAFGNRATGYAGTVRFTSNDPAATLPPNTAFTAGNLGIRTFTDAVTLRTTGTRTVTATDTVTASITGAQTGIQVIAPATQLAVTGILSPRGAGSAGTVTVEARDSGGNRVTAYRGTVRFTSTDPLATLPADYTFTAGDAGIHTFAGGVTLRTAGTHSVSVSGTGGVNSATADAGGYTFEATTFAFDELQAGVRTAVTGATYQVLADDGVTAGTAIGFDFPFYGTNYTLLRVGANGLASFLNATAPFACCAGVIAPNAAAPNAIVAPYWSNLDPSLASGAIYTATLGTAPNRRFVVEWKNVRDAGGAGAAQSTFELVLFETTGAIEFRLQSANADATQTYVTAFESATGTIGQTIRSGQYSLTNQAWLIGPFANTVRGSQTGIVVTPAAAATLVVTGVPSPRVAGTNGDVTVEALDAFGNRATGFTGTVRFTSSDAQAVLPANTAFTAGDAGLKTFTGGVSLRTVGTHTVTATDTVTASVTGQRTGVVVTPAAAATLVVTGVTSPVVAGVASNVTVEARDAYANRATGYVGTVRFGSSDTTATLPLNYTFLAGDAGVHTFALGVTLRLSGTQTVSATDTVTASVTGTQSGIVVNPAAAASLVVSGLTTPRVAGVSGSVTVEARDAFGNRATGYLGTVAFTSTDPLAVLPANVTYVAGDAGVKTVAGVALRTVGTFSVTATDTVTVAIRGSQTNVVVTPAAAASLVVTGLSSPRVAGTPSTLTVEARDAFGNRATGYTGTVRVTSSDSTAVLPANYTFTAGDQGLRTFPLPGVSLRAAGNQTVTVTDTTTASITGTSATIQVLGSSGTGLSVTGITSPTVAGVSNAVVVEALDTFGNRAIGYRGTVRFSTTDAQGVVPANYTFTAADAGIHTFPAAVILRTAGSQSVTVTDTVTAAIVGTQSGITVTPAGAASFVVSGVSTPRVAGTAGDVTVEARDSFGNVATGYTGAVRFGSTDTQAGLPAEYTFTAADQGRKSFPAGVSLRTVGTHDVSVSGPPGVGVTGGASTFDVAELTTFAWDELGTTTPRTPVSGATFVALNDDQLSTAIALPFAYPYLGNSYAAAYIGSNGFLSFTGDSTGVNVAAAVPSATPPNGYIAALWADLDPERTAEAGIFWAVLGTAPNRRFVAEWQAVPDWQTGGTTRRNTFQAVLFESGAFELRHLRTDPDVNQAYLVGYENAAGTAGGLILRGQPTSTNRAWRGTVVAGGITGRQTGIVVTPAAAASLVLTGISSPRVAGTPSDVVVEARDAFGNRATGYRGTVAFTSTDPLAVLPPSRAFTAGDLGRVTITGGVEFRTVGTRVVTATDTVSATLTGSHANVAVTPAAAASFVVTVAGTRTAGEVGDVTVEARDRFGNRATGYAGSVVFTTTDPGAIVPNTAAFVPAVDAGLRTYTGQLTFQVTGSQSVTATDSLDATIRGEATGIPVVPAAPSFFTFASLAATSVAGVPIDFTLEVRDAFGNLATQYVGTPTYTADDVQATLPAAVAFLSTDAARRPSVGELVFRTAGAQRLTVADGTIRAEATVTVAPAAATTLVLSDFANPAVAGVASDLRVTALDPFANVATGYLGRVALTSSDAASTLAPETTFVAADQGTHVIAGAVTWRTAGPQTLTGADLDAPTIVGEGALVVSPATPAQVVLSGPVAGIAGIDSTYDAVVQDEFGNTSPGLTPLTITLTGSTSAVVNSTNLGGAEPGTSQVGGTSPEDGLVSFVVRETVTGTVGVCISGSTFVTAAACVELAIAPAPADHVTLVTSDDSVLAGDVVTVDATVRDAFGNVSPSEVDVQFAVTGAATTTPEDGKVRTSTEGTASLTLTDRVAETVSLTVASARISDVELPVEVAHDASSIEFLPGPAHHVRVVTAPPTLAGVASTVTLQLVDQYENATVGEVPVCVTVSGDGGGEPTIEPGTLGAPTGEGAQRCGTTAADGSASVLVSDTKAESVTVAVASTGLPGSGADLGGAVVVSPAGRDHLRFTPASSTGTACNDTEVALRVVDAFDNPVVDGTGRLAVTLGVAAASGTVEIRSTTLSDATELPSATLTGTTGEDGSATFAVNLDAASDVTFTWSSADLPADPALFEPAPLPVLPGVADIANSTYTLSTPQVEAGWGEVTVDLTPRDACNVLLGAGRAVTFASAVGTFGDVVDNGDGSYRTTFRTPEGTCEATPVALEARVDGVVAGTAEVTSVCSQVDPEDTRVEVVEGTVDACASGDVYATFTVSPVGTTGLNMAPGQSVTVVVDGLKLVAGPVTAATDAAIGGVTAYTVSVGSNRCGPEARAVTVQVNGVTLATKPALTFTCPPVDPAKATFVASKPAASADGVDEIEVTVKAFDTCGNPAFGRATTFGVTNGAMELAIQGAPASFGDAPGEATDGAATFTLTAQLPGESGVTATTDGVTMTSAANLLTFTDLELIGGGCGCGPGASLGAWPLLALAFLGRRKSGRRL